MEKYLIVFLALLIFAGCAVETQPRDSKGRFCERGSSPDCK